MVGPNQILHRARWALLIVTAGFLLCGFCAFWQPASAAEPWLRHHSPSIVMAGSRAVYRGASRIVSTTLLSDELLVALVSPDRVTAFSSFARSPVFSNVAGIIPPHARTVPGNAEAILQASPDLVVLSEHSSARAEQLLRVSGFATLRLQQPRDFDELKTQITEFGRLLGVEARAHDIVVDLERRLAALGERRRGVRPRRALYYDGAGFSVGGETLVHAVLTTAGAYNALADLGAHGHRRLPRELLLALRPEIVILPDSAHAAAQRLAAEGFTTLEVPTAWLNTLSHHAIYAAEHVANHLWPEPSDARR